jgi:Gametolysin peptidase M11
VARRLLLVAAAVTALAGSAPAVAVVSGEQRLLVVRATWGPKPFTTEQVQRNIEHVDAFFRASSFGRVSFGGVVTPWLDAYSGPPSCDRAVIAAGGDQAARAAGYNLDSFTHIAYLYPSTDCFWTGARWGNRVMLNGTLTVTNTAHELGHTFGLGHAHAWSCDPRPCGVVNMGDPYDTMGSGTGDFNSYEKSLLGWITRLTVPSHAGTYALAPIERPSPQPQALIVNTARHRFWFEVRSEAARDEDGKLLGVPGLVVHIGPNLKLDTTNSPYGLLVNSLVLDPVGRRSPAMRAGDRYGERGSFGVVVLKGLGPSFRLRFTWADKTAPAPPSIGLPTARAGGITLTWRNAVERGSGVARYIVSLDGRAPVSIRERAYPDRNSILFEALTTGAHTVRIVAVDRAGNRGRPAVRRFTVDAS